MSITLLENILTEQNAMSPTLFFFSINVVFVTQLHKIISSLYATTTNVLEMEQSPTNSKRKKK